MKSRERIESVPDDEASDTVKLAEIIRRFDAYATARVKGGGREITAYRALLEAVEACR